MTDEVERKLQKGYEDGYTDHVHAIRSMMIGDHNIGDEVRVMGHTFRRASSERNLWDCVISTEEFDRTIDTIDADMIRQASDFLDEFAEGLGVDVDEADVRFNPPKMD